MKDKLIDILLWPLQRALWLYLDIKWKFRNPAVRAHQDREMRDR